MTGSTGRPVSPTRHACAGALLFVVAGCGRIGFGVEDVANDDAGAPNDDAGAPNDDAGEVLEPAFILYTFEESSGSTVRDRGAGGDALDLVIADLGQVQWEGEGLRIAGDTSVEGGVPARFPAAIDTSGAISVETWMVPAESVIEPPTPRRIVSFGSSTHFDATNLMLGQGDDVGTMAARWVVRSRTTSMPQPISLQSDNGAAQARLSHLVFVHAQGIMSLWLDGELLATRSGTSPIGSWESYPLTVANVPSGSRPWHGLLRRVAFYDRALTPQEIAARFDAGPPGPP